jgi:hypothetical protein
MVNSDDHPPPHVHVIKDGKAIYVYLETARAYRAKGNPTDAMIREAESVVRENIKACRKVWDTWHKKK